MGLLPKLHRHITFIPPILYKIGESFYKDESNLTNQVTILLLAHLMPGPLELDAVYDITVADVIDRSILHIILEALKVFIQNPICVFSLPYP